MPTTDSFDGNGDDKIFGRESQLNLSGAFGTVAFGRVGQLASANGSFGILGGASPFSGGWQDSVGQKFKKCLRTASPASTTPSPM